MIQLLWKNATTEVVGNDHGISQADLEAVHDRLVAAHRAVLDQVQSGRLGYAKLPTRTDYARQVKDLAARYKGNTTDLVVLGIGGSALGNIAL